MGQIQLYKPHPKQLEIHKGIESDIKYCVVSIGRQFGKTALGVNQGVKWCINDRWKVAWVSPTYKQCKKVFKDVERVFASCPAVSKFNKSDLIVHFHNGSELIFYSAEAYDTIRGETFDGLICDEFAFFRPEVWNEVLKATVLVRGKKVLILSTPKGKNLFYNLFNRGKDNDNYISFYGTSYDNPFIDPSEIEDARQSLPDHIFRQEYLAEFLDDAASVFKDFRDCVGQTTKGKYFYAGIDLGRADDYTVITVVNENNEEVYCDRWRHQPWASIIDKIVPILNRYKAHTYIEANGTQDAIYEQILSKINYNKTKVQPFVTTTKTKPAIIEDLMVMFERQEGKIIGHDWQLDELSYFTYEYNPKTRKVKYAAPVGLHDDYVMSRAIANAALKDLKSTGVYNVRRV